MHQDEAADRKERRDPRLAHAVQHRRHTFRNAAAPGIARQEMPAHDTACGETAQEVQLDDFVACHRPNGPQFAIPQVRNTLPVEDSSRRNDVGMTYAKPLQCK